MDRPIEYSVIIPVRDGERDLEILLDGLARTAPPGREIIVVDDGSRDGTAAVCARFGVRLLRQPPKGPAAARNAGAAAARGAVLVFADCDVSLPSGRDVVAEMAAALAARPEADCVLSISDVEPLRRSAIAYNASVYHAYYMERFLAKKGERLDRLMFFTTRLGAIRASSFRRSGGFHESLTMVMNEDGEFGARCHGLGFRTYLNAAFTHSHRYPDGWGRFARSYFLTALVQALIDRRTDTSPDESVSWAEKGRRLLCAALLACPLAAPVAGPARAATLAAGLAAALAVSFGGLHRLVWTRVPARYRPGWYLVYVAATPVILAGYLAGLWLWATGTPLLRGRRSSLSFFEAAEASPA